MTIPPICNVMHQPQSGTKSISKLLILLLSTTLVACSSTYVDKNDYDAETYEYIEEAEREYLGQFSYSGFTFAWKNFTTYQLSEKVQKAAIKKYGRNITLRNIVLKDGHKSALVCTGIAATAGFAMFAAGEETTTTTDKYGHEKEETEVNGVGTAGAFVLLASPVFALFKRYTITADVYKNSVAYKPAYLLLTEQENIETARRLYQISLAEKRRHLEDEKLKEARIANHEIWIGMSKVDLLKSRGDPIKATVKDDGQVAESVSASAGLSTIYGYGMASAVASNASTATTKTNRVQVYYYADSEIYIKDDVVIEIYDRKE